MSREVSLPDTSLAANEKATLEMRTDHWHRIEKALATLKSANYETIAKACNFSDRNQVSRRLKEMVGLGMIYRTDIKTATSSGRSAYNYSLTSQEKLTPIETVNTIIINATKTNNEQSQLNLF